MHDSKNNSLLHLVRGIRINTCSAGLYNHKRADLALIEINENANCSAVFTTNRFCAAPVTIARQNIKETQPRYCIINAGNANAGMGEQGITDAISVCNSVAENTGTNTSSILPFSTGVIGERLPVKKIIKCIPSLLQGMRDDGWTELSNSIITTDTRTKCISKQVKINGNLITFTGVAKGSGMIKPDMATMLSFIATDAGIKQDILDNMLIELVNNSFNCITVDGDTSTNDACLLVATDMSGLDYIDDIDSKNYKKIKDILQEIFIYLAKAIVMDGEGATKFVEVNVIEGKTESECRNIAENIAHSLLVKTALFASDPNWGRILAAIGRSNIEDLDTEKVSIEINGLKIMKDGKKSNNYNEEKGLAVMKNKEISICVDLNRGDAQSRIWTTDLSYEYIRINAEYRT